MLWMRPEDPLFSGGPANRSKEPLESTVNAEVSRWDLPVPLGPNKKKLEESVFRFRGIVSNFYAIFNLELTVPGILF